MGTEETDFLKALREGTLKGMPDWPVFTLAKVTEFGVGGVKLQRLGATVPDDRYYKIVTGSFVADDWVVCARVSGSLVVLGKLGTSPESLGGGGGGCYNVGPGCEYMTINAAVQAAVTNTPDDGAACICIFDKGSPYQEVVYLEDEDPPDENYYIWLPRKIHLFFHGMGPTKPEWSTEPAAEEPSGYAAVSYFANASKGYLRTLSFENITFTGRHGAVENDDTVSNTTGTTLIVKNCRWLHALWNFSSFIMWWREGHIYVEDCEFFGGGDWTSDIVGFVPNNDAPQDDMLLVFRGNTVYQFGAGGDFYSLGTGSKIWVYNNRFIECSVEGFVIGGPVGVDIHGNDVIDCDEGFPLVLESNHGELATGYVGPNSFRGTGLFVQQDETDMPLVLTVSRILQGPFSKLPTPPPPDVKLYTDTTTPALWWWDETQWWNIS
jgi:hypothetical protein